MPQNASEPQGGLRLALLAAAGLWVAALCVSAWTAPEQLGVMGVLVSRLVPVGIVAVVVACAAGLGMRLLRWLRLAPSEIGVEALFGAGLGLYAISLATLAFGVAGVMSPAALYGLLIACAGVSWREIRDLLSALLLRRASGEPRERPSLFRMAAGALVAVVALAMLIHAFVPPLDYDALEYHLGLPAMFYRAGHISAVPLNVFAAFPQGVEMLYLAGMILSGGVLEGAAMAKLLNIALAALAAGATYAIGSHACRSRVAGLVAGLVVFMLPGMALYGTVNVYVETGLMFFSALAVAAFLFSILPDQALGLSSTRWLVLAGLAAGMALGCKYTAGLLLIPPLLLGVLLYGAFSKWTLPRLAGHVAIFVGCAALAFLPWLVRNAAFYGNPVHPFLGSLLGSVGWSTDAAERFAAAHRAATVSLWGVSEKFWEAVLYDRGASVLLVLLLPLFPLADGRRGPAVLLSAFFLLFVGCDSLMRTPSGPGGGAAAWFAQHARPWLGIGLFLTPLAVLPRNGGRAPAALWAFFVMGFFLWFALTHQAARFLFPLLFAPAVLSGLGAAALLKTRAAGLTKALLLLGLLLAASTSFLVQLDGFKAGVGLETPDEYLTRQTSTAPSGAVPEFNYAAMIFINHELPQDRARVLFVGEAETFYCERPLVASTVFNEHPLTELAERFAAAPAHIADELMQADVHYLYVNWLQIDRQEQTYRRPALTAALVERILTQLRDAGRIRLIKGFRPERSGRWPFELYELLPPSSGS